MYENLLPRFYAMLKQKHAQMQQVNNTIPYSNTSRFCHEVLKRTRRTWIVGCFLQ